MFYQAIFPDHPPVKNADPWLEKDFPSQIGGGPSAPGYFLGKPYGNHREYRGYRPLRHPRGLRIYNNMLCIHTFQKVLISFVSRTGGDLILILKDYGTVEGLTLAAITRI